MLRSIAKKSGESVPKKKRKFTVWKDLQKRKVFSQEVE